MKGKNIMKKNDNEYKENGDNMEFYIPEGKIIPTKLRLKKDKVHIYYKELDDKFGYEFKLYEIDSKEQGENIVKDIANIMCNQSYDYGSEWRIVNIECIKFNDNYWSKSGKWQVTFRIKDSY